MKSNFCAGSYAKLVGVKCQFLPNHCVCARSKATPDSSPKTSALRDRDNGSFLDHSDSIPVRQAQMNDAQKHLCFVAARSEEG